MVSANNDWTPFVVSAPGKVILFGEHAVVYGKAAIAGSVDMRAYALVTPRNDNRARMAFPDIDIDVLFDGDTLPRLGSNDLVHPSEVEALVPEGINVSEGPGRIAILTFVYLYGSILAGRNEGAAGFNICVRSLLPVGAGLGSSAAFNVALSAALLQLSGQLQTDGSGAVDRKLINQWAFQGEQVAHGTPSGIDNSVATYGGFLKYVKGEASVSLNSRHALRVLITNTNVPKSTKALVAGVRSLRDRHPAVIDGILDTIHSIATSAAALFQSDSGDATDMAALELQVQDIIQINHGLLSTLGVSHASLERVRAITAARGLASKLTGAGGGGCALTLIPHGTPDDSVDAVERELAVEGFQCYRTVVGGGGVAITREVRGCSIEMWLRSLLDQQQQNTSQSCSDVFDIEIAGFAAFSAGSIAELKPE
ncbi:Mevalonate kinase [Coemansia thaxteri]|uniref:Mevalonate kinase n=1 Tax=Coemansia thaxteri TaxID=2663907 RepID=A0A9W8BND7_9FUNG|nr:Mevalonate kinase [Coemansia thaxteri]